MADSFHFVIFNGLCSILDKRRDGRSGILGDQKGSLGSVSILGYNILYKGILDSLPSKTGYQDNFSQQLLLNIFI